MRRIIALVAALVVVAPSAAATAAAPPPPAQHANAEGDPVLGGLRYAPADLTARVGDAVAWTNTDLFAPHTVTEVHNLWNLAGTYGQTPVNPPGFGPRTTVQRIFEAGTQHFYCLVHGPVMSGSVAVPVDVSATRTKVRVKQRGRRHRHARRRTVADVHMLWAAATEPEGLVFDVERRRPGGDWAPVATATDATGGTFRTSPGTAWEVRARLRRSTDADAATDWSPVASVTA